MGSRRSTSTQTTNQTQTQTAPGTGFGQSLIGNELQQLRGDVMGQTAFTGDRVATAPDLGAGNYAAQWGPTPTTFVPQMTAGQGPNQTAVTHVDPNAQEGIDAGLAAATQNQARIPGMTNDLYDYWQGIISGGGQNPHLQSVIDATTRDANYAAGQREADSAYMLGAQGAFGGSADAQGRAWREQMNAEQLDGVIGRMRYEDFRNTQGMIQGAPGALQQIAATSTIPAEQFARYGGMRQQNLMAAAAAGDENAQRLSNNLWMAQNLNDRNAIAAAQEAVAQWEAAYRTDEARVADLQGRTAAGVARDQAGLDNEYLRWLAEWENTQAQIQGLGGVADIAYGTPGGTSTMNGTTTTTSRESQPAWQQIAGLASGIGSMFAPGGIFSGGLSALGGAGRTAGALGGAMVGTPGPQATQNLGWLQNAWATPPYRPPGG